MSGIEQLVKGQVLSWSKSDAVAKGKKEARVDWPVITISRQYGARGRSLAHKLGEMIGFDVWDKTLLSAIAKEAGADEQFLSSLDEKRRKMIDDLMVGTFMGSKHTNTHYFRSLLRAVQAIGAQGKSIIVGRGSNYIIKAPDALRIRLVCDIENRTTFVAKSEGISEKEALKLIKVRDAERIDFIRHYFNHTPWEAEDYDLVLNSGRFDVDQLAKIVLFAYEQKIGKVLPGKN